jgi:hypothetical protein
MTASSSMSWCEASLTLNVTSITLLSDAPTVTSPLLVVTRALTTPDASNCSWRSNFGVTTIPPLWLPDDLSDVVFLDMVFTFTIS